MVYCVSSFVIFSPFVLLVLWALYPNAREIEPYAALAGFIFGTMEYIRRRFKIPEQKIVEEVVERDPDFWNSPLITSLKRQSERLKELEQNIEEFRVEHEKRIIEIDTMLQDETYQAAFPRLRELKQESEALLEKGIAQLNKFKKMYPED